MGYETNTVPFFYTHTRKNTLKPFFEEAEYEEVEDLGKHLSIQLLPLLFCSFHQLKKNPSEMWLKKSLQSSAENEERIL